MIALGPQDLSYSQSYIKKTNKQRNKETNKQTRKQQQQQLNYRSTLIYKTACNKIKYIHRAMYKVIIPSKNNILKIK